MYTREDVLSYTCPKSHDWPEIDLYMDQLISLLESRVAIFYSDTPKPVTATMINNYVKQKIVPPSRKKKYSRAHLERLYVIFLLKPALTLPDICKLLSIIDARQGSSYDDLVHEIMGALDRVFANGAIPVCEAATDPFKSAALAFAYTLLTRLYLAENA